MPSILRYQPVKGVFILYKVALLLFVQTPYYIISSILPSWRPRRSWGIGRTVMVKLYRAIFSLEILVGPLIPNPDHRAIVPGRNVNGVWVDPVPKLITGDIKLWAKIASVEPARIPGYWYHKKGSNIAVGASPTPGEKVCYRLHGGGFILTSASPSDMTSAISSGIVEHCDPIQRVFAIEYRLASTPPYKPAANPFPTAILDALAGYHYLVNTVGFDPADIIVEGDSAGGNLAIALTRYLIENRNHHTPDVPLPSPPSGLILISPWVDLGSSHNGPSSSAVTNYSSDYVYGYDHFVTHYSKRAFVGPHGIGVTEMNRYISPASKGPHIQADFKGFPATLIVAGGAEMLYDQIVTLKEKMVNDIGDSATGGKVTFFEKEDAVHIFPAFGWQEPERSECWKAIENWLPTI